MEQNENQDTAADAGGGRTAPAASRDGRGGGTRLLAVAALIVAVTAPFWEDAVLASVNMRTPMARRLAETALTQDRLERRQAELERQLAAATAQLAQLQSRAAQRDGRVDAEVASTRTLALVALGAALRRPGPFDLELAMVRAGVPSPDELGTLLGQIEPYAATGIPGLAQLRQEFATLSSRIEWSARADTPAGWVRRLVPWPRSATEAPEAATPDATLPLLAEANRQLRNDNLAGALSAVQRLDAARRESLTDWTEDASARVAADAVARRVGDLVAQQLGAAAARPASHP